MTKATTFEKILSDRVLLIANIVIIIVTELSGNFFLDTGIIHLIALGFVVLGISRIFVHYNVYDHYLRLLIGGGVLALLIFSASHLVEFLGYMYFKIYEDAIFVSVINFYIASMLAIVIGAEYFLVALKKGRLATIIVSSVGMLGFLFLSAVIFSGQLPVSLELTVSTPYIYAVLVLGVSILSVNRLLKIKKHVSIMVGFANYFIAAFALIATSALLYVFYDPLKELGMPDIQILFVSHFLFYGALSLMFLAFVRLSNLGGIYEEVETYEKSNSIKK